MAMTTEESRDRQALYREVQHERISPAAADAQLRQWGQRPFQSRQDPIIFDPMTEPEWTLPMAAAWFIWRSAEAVRDQWNPAREGWRKWVQIPKPGSAVGGPRGPRWELKTLGRATLGEVFSQAGLSRSTRPGNATALKNVASYPIHTPYSRLKGAFCSGRLRTSWGKREEGDFGEMAPEYWRRKFDALANRTKPSSLARPTSAPALSTAKALICHEGKQEPRQSAGLIADTIRAKGLDIVEDLPNLSIFDDFNSNNVGNIWTYAVPFDDNSDVFVGRDDVIKVEREISQNEYEQPDWDLGQILGWIAYQKRENFRSLWEPDLSPRPTFYGEEYFPDFANNDPLGALKEKLLSGTLVAYQDGEAILSTKWIGSKLWDRPRVKFTRAGVIKIWKELPLAASPKKPRASKETMIEIHEGLRAERGSQPSEQEFRDRLNERGFDSNVKRAREFREKYAAENGISFDPGPRGKRQPR
jgi:hypothetical protein